MKKIVFLLPNNASKPVGGVKVVLEYANRLAADGFDVELVYGAYTRWMTFGLLHTLYYLLIFLLQKAVKSYRPRWFSLDGRVQQRLVWSHGRYHYPKDAIVVATAVDTAWYLNHYSLPKEQRYYFIQDFENWFVDDNFVRETYHYKMQKIVISRWLQKVVEACGETAAIVPNGFDFHFFTLSTPIERRSPEEIIALYHTDKRKGLDVAFEAFRLARECVPQLHVTLFGTPNCPEGLPEWIEYHQRPDKETFNRIYNRAAIFVGSSYTEGWGLTVGEAMQCGCAVACTDNKGYLEMAKDGDTALVSPVGDANALADNIVRLIGNDELRCQIAENGYKFIHQFDVDESYEKFKEIIIVGKDV